MVSGPTVEELYLGQGARHRAGRGRDVESRSQGRQQVHILVNVRWEGGEEIGENGLVAEEVYGLRPQAGEQVVGKPLPPPGVAIGNRSIEIDQARVAPEHGALGDPGAGAVDDGQRLCPPLGTGQLDGAVVGRHRGVRQSLLSHRLSNEGGLNLPCLVE